MVREKAKLSQEELAEKLGVTQTTITRYENGHRLPCADFLESLVKLSGCDPGWLLAGEAEITEVPCAGDLPGSDYILVPRV
ncbi:MAG: helix-turn-helix transcriptional regulator, partial [Deltaproteobacteria bacterium]